MGMQAYDPVADEARDLAMRIARGEDPVRRIVTMKWFHYEVEGEEVLFGDALRREVESLGGALREETPVEFPAERVLRFVDTPAAWAKLGTGETK